MTTATQSVEKSAIERACDMTGGQSGLASLFNISPQSVQKWVAKKTVPPSRAMAIERFTGGAVKAVELCPSCFSEQQAA